MEGSTSCGAFIFFAVAKDRPEDIVKNQIDFITIKNAIMTQFGFRYGYGLRKPLFAMQILVQECLDQPKGIYVCFIEASTTRKRSILLTMTNL